MLAGLLLAVQEADDRPGTLTATLPFGGATLIEYQARLLIGAGASQLVVLVSRLTPELLGALGRIGKRQIAVDPVRSAAEAAEKLHPLARVLMLADGLTTTDEVIDAVARDGGDALLVVDDAAMMPGYERVGGGMAWAGVARLDPRRVSELAAMPRDYDTQSTLLRLASQAGAAHVALPADAVRRGHAIQHSEVALEARGRTVLAAMVSTRRGWFDRYAVAPIARALVPVLVPRAVPTLAIAAAGAATGLAAVATIVLAHPLAGTLLALIGAITLAIASVYAELRDEQQTAALRLAPSVLAAVTALAYGYQASLITGDASPRVAAVALVAIAVLAERAIGGIPRRRWWGSGPAYLLPVVLGAAMSMPLAGLAVAAGYAVATCASAIERLRRQA